MESKTVANNSRIILAADRFQAQNYIANRKAMTLNVKPRVFHRIFDLNNQFAMITGAATGFGELIAAR
jgi:hypothetical protein